MSDSYTEMFRRLSPLTDYLPFPNIQVDRLLSLIPGSRGTPVASPTPTRIAPTQTTEPTQPAAQPPPDNQPPADNPAATRRPASRPPTITPGTASTPAPQMPGQENQSLLDMLRDRTAKKFTNENLESLSDIGAGMLASESPNFFTMLGAGLRNQAEREKERSRELRETASEDRRAAMELAKFREETSPNTLTGRLRQAQIANYLAQAGAVNRPQYQLTGVDANGNAVVVDLRNPSNTRTLEGVRPTSMLRGQTLTPGRIAELRLGAEAAAQREARNSPIPRSSEWISTRAAEIFDATLRAAQDGSMFPGQVPTPAAPTTPPDTNVRTLPGLR